MNREEIKNLLVEFSRGDMSLEETLERLTVLPYLKTEDIILDTHRELRCGFPEVILGEGKSPDQILSAAKAFAETEGAFLATRLEKKTVELLEKEFPGGYANFRARTFRYRRKQGEFQKEARTVAIISAGAADLPVAEEALETLTHLGIPSLPITDSGVAGLHRLLQHHSALREVFIKIVLAGMEGALPSVVGGIFGGPVIAVPTSVGYGVGRGGLTALAGMLSSCVPGITVVNIDNGFGAAAAAAMMARL
ncbi:MAG: nickel pincer cofactor biosynthesis protein LarB [Candidatus Hydrogenedentota bacterium]|nr:MAG: nickel pincer cofactor biosynthesis protein LarB [Candidatus Hydrogenedentota bacterium]